jgi:putative transposase
VQTAHTTHRALAVENLDGITRRLAGQVSRDQRRLLHGWGFFQLRTFLAYKVEAAGIPVYAVDPRHTSQTCPSCGVIDRKNRKTQAAFLCVSCGFAGHADHVAATNIARRGTVVAGVFVNHPYFSEARTVVSHDGAASLGKSCSL